MSNWFEDHPVKSIIAHTFFVAAATGAAFIFVFDSSKVESAKAETEQHKAKIGALETEIANLRSENAKYLGWLMEAPKSIPYLDKKIADLTKENQEFRIRVGTQEVRPNITTTEGREATISIGDTFVDDVTGFTLGLLNVNSDFSADILIVYPDGERKELKGVKAGDQWRYHFNNVSHQAQIRNINWFSNKIMVAARKLLIDP